MPRIPVAYPDGWHRFPGGQKIHPDDGKPYNWWAMFRDGLPIRVALRDDLESIDPNLPTADAASGDVQEIEKFWGITVYELFGGTLRSCPRHGEVVKPTTKATILPSSSTGPVPSAMERDIVAKAMEEVNRSFRATARSWPTCPNGGTLTLAPRLDRANSLVGGHWECDCKK